MSLDLSAQSALDAHRENALRAATPELLLDESGDNPLGATSRIARTAEAEGKREEQSALAERENETTTQRDRSDRSSEDGRGRILNFRA